ncbi:UNVERIFIED_CONTAM: Cers1 [Trichonephila clavipes]
MDDLYNYRCNFFSFPRYHNIGSLVLFTHDACDILLEFTKLNVYFKIQGGKLKRRHEIFANISFFCFTVAWYVCRLYWYPLRVLYTATSDVQRMKLVLPGALLMNSLLWILQILNIYWFLFRKVNGYQGFMEFSSLVHSGKIKFILQFLFRVATGQVKEVDDTREYDVEEKLIQTSKTHSTKNGLVNGNMKTNGSCDDGVVLNGNAAGTHSTREKKD